MPRKPELRHGYTLKQWQLHYGISQRTWKNWVKAKAPVYDPEAMKEWRAKLRGAGRGADLVHAKIGVPLELPPAKKEVGTTEQEEMTELLTDGEDGEATDLARRLEQQRRITRLIGNTIEKELEKGALQLASLNQWNKTLDGLRNLELAWQKVAEKRGELLLKKDVAVEWSGMLERARARMQARFVAAKPDTVDPISWTGTVKDLLNEAFTDLAEALA